MTKLSAPTDPWLAEFERYSVPFGLEINGVYVRTPPSAWSRVFEGPIGADGNPSNRGGLTSAEVSLMRETSRAQQPTDERRRMPAPSEAARARDFPINANTLGTRTVSAGARAEHLGLPKATPSGGTSC